MRWYMSACAAKERPHRRARRLLLSADIERQELKAKEEVKKAAKRVGGGGNGVARARCGRFVRSGACQASTQLPCLLPPCLVPRPVPLCITG